MKEFNGTPGPWRFDEQETLSGCPVFYIAQNDNAKYTPNYSDVSQTCSGELKHIQKANAQLIAAAPDLLEVMQEVIEQWKVEHDEKGEPQPLWVKNGLRAISKALGEE